MFKEHPLLSLIIMSLIISVLLVIIVIKQCFVKRRFLKIKMFIAFVVTFIFSMFLVFFKNLEENETLWQIIAWIILGLDVIVGAMIFICIDFSFENESLQKLLTKSLDETKLYVLLDKKDKVKEISKKLANELEIDPTQAYGKNFFDVLEIKYRITGLNGQDCFKNDAKSFYSHYEKKAAPDSNNVIEIEMDAEDGTELTMYFNESTLFNNSRYRGRILMGDIKNGEELFGMEKEINENKNEINSLKGRFITILEKSTEGIFFNNLSDGSIWCNDTLLTKLNLEGNTFNNEDFYKRIHKDDQAFYIEKLKSIKAEEEYKISYRFHNGVDYVYVNEVGKKLVNGKIIELCGIISPVDNQKFGKTDTILDTLGDDTSMQRDFNKLLQDEQVFQVMRFEVASIPDVNEKYGRAIGNMLMANYVQFIKDKFIDGAYMYRVSGLEYVGFITDYRKMDLLKSSLTNGEKILHPKTDYLNNESIKTEVYMGIAYTSDTLNHKEALSNARDALRVAKNPQFHTNYAYFREIK